MNISIIYQKINKKLCKRCITKILILCKWSHRLSQLCSLLTSQQCLYLKHVIQSQVLYMCFRFAFLKASLAISIPLKKQTSRLRTVTIWYQGHTKKPSSSNHLKSQPCISGEYVGLVFLVGPPGVALVWVPCTLQFDEGFMSCVGFLITLWPALLVQP